MPPGDLPPLPTAAEATAKAPAKAPARATAGAKAGAPASKMDLEFIRAIGIVGLDSNDEPEAEQARNSK